MSSNKIVVQRGEDEVVFYEPLPHQEQFHASQKTYTLQSGGRGSGKSIAIRMDAHIHCLSIPRFRALILRRSVPELKSSHLQFVPFEAEALGLSRDAWHSTDMVLRYPNGSTLRFGHVENDEALTKYLSSELEVIYLDELATFSFRQFAFLCTSLRSPIKGWKPKLKAGTNPVGPGAGWCRRFFIEKTITPEEMPGYDPNEVETIHANMTENPHVDREGYAKILASIPSEALRRALKDGEWTIEGQAFSEWAPMKDGKPWHVIDEMPRWKGKSVLDIPGLEVIRGLDWGYAPGQNPGVCLWFLALPDGSLLGFKEFVFSELLPSEAAKEILRRSAGMKVRYTVADPSMWQAHDGPSVAEHMEVTGLGLIPGDHAREAGWIAMHTWLRSTVNDGTGERPKLRFLSGSSVHDLGCPKTILNIPQMLNDPKKPGDIITVGVPDDEADVTRYVCMSRVGPSKEKPPMDPSFRAFLHSIRRAKRQSAALRGYR